MIDKKDLHHYITTMYVPSDYFVIFKAYYLKRDELISQSKYLKFFHFSMVHNNKD